MPQSDDSPKLAYERPDIERPASSAAPEPEALQLESAKHDPYAALRFRDFCIFEAGYVINVIADQIAEVAVGWEVYQRTHDALSLGWVGLVTAAPVILLALPAGHLADRFDRRRVVFISQLLNTVCILMLAMISRASGPVGEMYAVLFVVAVAKATGGPARSALLPSIVPTEHFANAIAWNSMCFQISAMVGPALGGLLVTWRVSTAFVVASILSAIFAAIMLIIRLQPVADRREPATLKSLAAGVRFVYSNKIILATITMDLFAVLLGGAVYLLPLFATDRLGVGAVGFGWLRAAPALGALAMALTVTHLPPFKHAGRAMLWAVAGFGMATIVFGLSRSYTLSLAMLFLTGAFDNISVLVRHTLVQVLTPDAMRGRVSAVNNVFIGASNELGGFESGVTARLFGAVVSVVGGGIGTIVVVLTIMGIFPQVRSFGSLQDARPQQELAEPPAAAEAVEFGKPGAT